MPRGPSWIPLAPPCCRRISATGRARPAVFAAVPDFQAELLRSACEADTGWTEWHWLGTRTDETRLDKRGVTIFGVRDDRIVWGRLYLEDVEGGQEIDQAVQHMARGTE